MRYLFPLLFLSLLVLSACQSPDLERAEVPLLWGIRYEGEDAGQWLEQNLEVEGRGTEWMIEIPIIAGDSNFPTIPELPLEELGRGLAAQQISFNLAFTTSFGKELFPTGKLVDTTAWFHALTNEVKECLEAIHQEPRRLIVGNDWKLAEPAQAHWRQLFQDLKSTTNSQLGYGWNGDRLTLPPWIDVCDFFALEYPPVADPNPKPYAIQNNQRMGRAADSLGLPLFIYRGNVMGNYKTIGLKNRLRFWPEEVQVTGLVANSLYAKLPLLDSSSYFGVMQDQEFINYWKSYQNIQE